MSGLPVSARDVSAGTVEVGTFCTLHPYPCSRIKLDMDVTTAAEAQFISVMVTEPQSAAIVTGEIKLMSIAAGIERSDFIRYAHPVYVGWLRSGLRLGKSRR
ncbi:hypothetical protein PSAC2689_80110 [Paraburkholderia sacchari]